MAAYRRIFEQAALRLLAACGPFFDVLGKRHRRFGAAVIDSCDRSTLGSQAQCWGLARWPRL
jgi:hypothetical protein